MQLTETTSNQAVQIKSMFDTPHLLFTLEAVLAGHTNIRIWVDDPINPQSVFMTDMEYCYFLGGDSQNETFNHALETLLNQTVIPKAISKGMTYFKIEFSGPSWDKIIHKLLVDKLPRTADRVFYQITHLALFDWKKHLPAEYEIYPIDQALLDRNLTYTQFIVDEITHCWKSLETFLTHGFGVCAIHIPTNSIQGWCTGEYFSKDKCGIGIEVARKHRGRGLATVLAVAFVEQSIARGLTPHWDASATNGASIRVAQKVGFQKIHDYQAIVGAFIHVESFQGNHYYGLKDYSTAASWFEKAAKQDQYPSRNYYNAACARALAEQNDQALDNLQHALAELSTPTMQFLEQIKQDQDLKNLHNHPEWQMIVQRIQALEASIKNDTS